MSNSNQIKLGFTIGHHNIPRLITPLIDETIECYREYHKDLRSVYVIGSVAVGDFREGISDLDTIGITDTPSGYDTDKRRRQKQTGIGNRHNIISFVDNAVISMQELSIQPMPHTTYAAATASKIASSGLCVWGERVISNNNLPTVDEMAFGRMQRVEQLMVKYRSGDLIEPFKNDQKLLVRSCAKASMRVVSGITLLRGADYYSSPYETARQVPVFAPEASLLSKLAMKTIDKSDITVELSMSIADEAVNLFRRLFGRQ